MSDTYEFRAQLGTLYEAARVEFPKYANMVSTCAETLSESLSAYQMQVGPMLDPEPMVDAIAMNTECYNLLRRAVIFLNNGAEALNTAADNFARTDENAAHSSQDIQGLLKIPLKGAPVPATLPKGTS